MGCEGASSESAAVRTGWRRSRSRRWGVWWLMLATSVILTRAIFAGGELAAQQPRFWPGVMPLACDDLPDELPLESLRQRVKSLDVDGQAASAGDSDAGGDSGASGEREGTLAGGGDAKAKGASGSGAGSDEKGGSGGDGEDDSYYVRPLGYATIPDSEPPRYVTDLLSLEWVESPERNWLDLGFDYRMRYEYRDDDLRRPVAVRDEPLLLRTRGYLGLKEVLDPFRFTVEFEDAGLANSQFPDTPRDVNRNELIQMYAELFFDELPGVDRQVEVRYGRMAFEVVDRRLIARNEWRNTTNEFQGLRGIVGRQEDDWQLDLFALNPLVLDTVRIDAADTSTGFYGVVGDWRRWSRLVTMQPYYMVLDQHAGGRLPPSEIHTVGWRGYGVFEESGWDFDSDVAYQFGHVVSGRHRAFGVTGELGYSPDDPNKTRLSGFVGYASGDRDPNDLDSERFERLYGFGRPWSSNDYIIWENIIAPKVRMEMQPHEKLRLDGGYHTYWLASATDAWVTTNLQDPTGQSGTFLGQELDIRVRWAANSRTNLTIGYAHFMPGEFPKSFGRSEDTDFLYFEALISLFPAKR